MPSESKGGRSVESGLLRVAIAALAIWGIRSALFPSSLQQQDFRKDLLGTSTPLPPALEARTQDNKGRNPIAVDVDEASCKAHCLERNRRSPNALPADPQCTSKNWWCQLNFAPSIVHDMCALICGNQFPSNCSDAQFLVMRNEWDWGLGSNFHIRMVLLIIALSEKRVFIYSEQPSLWTYREDGDRECASGRVDCYFLPITQCTLPKDWFSRARRYSRRASHKDYQYVYADSVYNIGHFNPKTKPVLSSNLTHLTRLPMSYWNAQFAAFMYRPTQRVMDRVIAPHISATFPRGIVPERFLSVFVRSGDKGYEAELHDPQEYWKHIKLLCEQHQIRDVYISTDSRVAKDALFLQLAPQRPDLRLFALNVSRLDNGLTMALLKPMWRTRAIRTLIDTALADLHISQQAIVWLGTLSSNWCRLQNEMRCSNAGRWGTVYHSLDWNGKRHHLAPPPGRWLTSYFVRNNRVDTEVARQIDGEIL